MKLIAASLLVLAAPLLAQGPCSDQSARSCADSQVITTSGNTITIPSSAGGMVASFEEVMTGTPATVSVTISGCMPGGTCDLLDTNTTVATAIRSPNLLKVYKNFKVNATWTGGTAPTVQVNTMITTALNPQSGSSNLLASNNSWGGSNTWGGATTFQGAVAMQTNMTFSSGKSLLFSGARQFGITWNSGAWYLGDNTNGNFPISVQVLSTGIDAVCLGTQSCSSQLTVHGAVSNGVATTTNTDNRGTITLAAGAGSYTFTQGAGTSGVWTTPPTCVFFDVTNSTHQVTPTVTVSTITLAGTLTDVINYICWGGT